MRMAGVRTEMICRKEGKSNEDYSAFVQEMGADTMLVLAGEEVILQDYMNRTREKKSLKDFREEY